jgi:hypothetical protein
VRSKNRAPKPPPPHLAGKPTALHLSPPLITDVVEMQPQHPRPQERRPRHRAEESIPGQEEEDGEEAIRWIDSQDGAESGGEGGASGDVGGGEEGE